MHTSNSVEEKIFQRQLSKEGLQSVVDDKEQVNALCTKDLRNLFKLRSGTPSDTHDKLKCERCKIIADDAELQAANILPRKLETCRELLKKMMKREDATKFLKPFDPNVEEQDGSSTAVTRAEYDKVVKQPMDFNFISNKLDTTIRNLSMSNDSHNTTTKNNKTTNASYKSVSEFSKDINRIFSNVFKVWFPGKDLIADLARDLQSWWIEEWTAIVPILMNMKADDNGINSAILQDRDENMSTDDALLNSSLHNNERGEDYQEQIGMPDEENMRHWSHHHSADTTDDPIFRAAMRGYDTVSFVFGLEVTWSLIQQRQQEEEERIAMVELEQLEALEADNAEVIKEVSNNDDETTSSSDINIEENVEENSNEEDVNNEESPKRQKTLESTELSSDF